MNLKWISAKSPLAIVLCISFLLAGCGLIEIAIPYGRTDIPAQIDVQNDAISLLPEELIYASSPELSVENVIKKLEKHTTAIHLVDSDMFWNAVVPGTDRLTPAELCSPTYTERLRAINVDAVAIIEASQVEHIGGRLKGTMSTVLIDAEHRFPVRKISVSVIPYKAFVVPLPPFLLGFERGGMFDFETPAQEVISNEIIKYLVRSYDKPVDIAVLWPVTPETERARKFRGCKGTWQEIKKCVNEKD